MKQLSRVVVLVLTIAGFSLKSSFGDETNASHSVPVEVKQAFESQGLTKRYAFTFHLKPSYLQGDFNGDGKVDEAVLIKKRGTGKVGIAIVHGGSNQVFILGAGRSFGNGGDDFSWMDNWSIQQKGSVEQGADENTLPVLKGQAIFVEKTDSASALIYWDGKKYVWEQEGD